VNARLRMAACVATLALSVPSAVFGQSAAPGSLLASPPESTTSKAWVVAGGAFAVIRGDCQTCEDDFPYRNAGGVLADVGYRVTPRMDVGAEVFWTSTETASGHLRTTHLDAVTQFRPWASRGFFVKGGAGMAFVRNWVDATGPGAINSKALSVVVGAGWVFRPAERVGLQIFAAQHATALGDLQTGDGAVGDVVGNSWSIGAAIVIR
jgi:hypothetical protein